MTAKTFERETDARDYAEAFAREQTAAGVSGAKIDVRSRRGDALVVSYPVGA